MFNPTPTRYTEQKKKKKKENRFRMCLVFVTVDFVKKNFLVHDGKEEKRTPTNRSVCGTEAAMLAGTGPEGEVSVGRCRCC